MADFGKFISPVIAEFEATQAREGNTSRKYVSYPGQPQPVAFQVFKEGEGELLSLDNFDVIKAAKLAAFFDHCALTFSLVAKTTLVRRPRNHHVFSYSYFESISVPVGENTNHRAIFGASTAERACFNTLDSLPLPLDVKFPRHEPELRVALKAADFIVRGNSTNACILTCQLGGLRSFHRFGPPGSLRARPVRHVFLGDYSALPPASAVTETDGSRDEGLIPCYVCGATISRPWKRARDVEGAAP